MRRIFLALTLSEALQAEIIAWETKYDRLLARHSLPGRHSFSDGGGDGGLVRWLLGHNLHVTLVPPWHTDDLDPVLVSLRRPSGVKSFEYEFHHVSFGPNMRSPRLIWAEGRPSPEAARLKEELEKAVGERVAAPGWGEPRLGVPRRERRPFNPHLTLARFRPEHFARLPVKKINDYVSWREKADSFSLIETHLRPSGAEYEILETFKLR